MRAPENRCLVCGLTEFHPFVYEAHDRMFDRHGDFFYERCAGCGFVRQYPRITPAKLTSHYPATGYYAYQDEPSPGLFDRIRQYLLQRYYQSTFLTRFLTLIIPNVPAIPSFVRGGRVLDLGCGTGDTLLSLVSLGWNGYGMDIDKSAVETARRRGLKNVSRGYWEDISDFPDGFFDAIRLYHVIEHLGNPKECLSIIKKKLKTGGELLIGTPNAGSLATRLFGTYWYNLDAPRHLFLFTPYNLARLLRGEGYAVSSVQFCSGGGILGSVGYLLHCQLISRAWLVMLFYPLEWFLDKVGLGDVFVVRAHNVDS